MTKLESWLEQAKNEDCEIYDIDMFIDNLSKYWRRK